jgi:hypothetical protein
MRRFENPLRKSLIALSAAGAAASATPALADAPPPVTPATNPCTAVYVQGAIACQGYYGGNLFQGDAGSATAQDVRDVIALLLNGTASTGDTLPTNNTGDYTPPYSLLYNTVLGAIPHQADGDATFDFGSLNLSGLTIFGAHFGNNSDGGDAQNISAIWLLDLGSNPTHIVTLTDGQGVSNAQIFATGGAVPEPATWAMMLLGFGGIGTAMRRGRKPALAQIA